MNDRLPHQSNLRKGRFSHSGTAFYITKCLEVRENKYLAQPGAAPIIIDSFDWMRKNDHSKLCGFCIMPSHYHSILGITAARTLEQIMESIDKYTAREINNILNRKGKFWQEGFFDHAIRNPANFKAIIDYIHQNPVRAGLVERAEEWPFSTANLRYTDWINWEWIGMISNFDR